MLENAIPESSGDGAAEHGRWFELPVRRRRRSPAHEQETVTRMLWPGPTTQCIAQHGICNLPHDSDTNHRNIPSRIVLL